MGSQSRLSVAPGSKVLLKKEALKLLQKSITDDSKPLQISVESPQYLFDSIQLIANKASQLEIQLSRNRENLGYYVKRINEKFKNTDWILKDMLHSQSLIQGEGQEASKYDSVLNETILENGVDGKVRFEDLIDVPSNYDMDVDENDDVSVVMKVDLNTFNLIAKNSCTFEEASERNDTFNLSKDTVPQSKLCLPHEIKMQVCLDYRR